MVRQRTPLPRSDRTSVQGATRTGLHPVFFPHSFGSARQDDFLTSGNHPNPLFFPHSFDSARRPFSPTNQPPRPRGGGGFLLSSVPPVAPRHDPDGTEAPRPGHALSGTHDRGVRQRRRPTAFPSPPAGTMAGERRFLFSAALTPPAHYGTGPAQRRVRPHTTPVTHSPARHSMPRRLADPPVR